MRCIWIAGAIGLCFTVAAANAGNVVQSIFEQRFSDIERDSDEAASVSLAQYMGASRRLPPPQPDSQTGPLLPSCESVADDVCWSPYDAVYGKGSWHVGVGVMPTQCNFTWAKFGGWEDHYGAAVRLNLGYEKPDGLGVRGRIWAFGIDTETYVTDLELSACTVSLDLYKRLRSNQGELALGAGWVSDNIVFRLPDETESEFTSSGINLFADGRYSLWEFTRGDIGAVGRGRMGIVRGDWHDSTDSVVPDTNGDTLTTLEAALGIDFRRRFGRCEDHYWYFAISSEIQQWTSPWLDRYTGTALGFSGLSIDCGIVW